ncbi:MAG: efflux RND transporter periplasmic adaptor subunit [Verrucomicrobiae bacterium]|nr:efflux RND transporter periplasmic adaptor subunit [Verrucomicrobiae bacterium]
MKNSNIIKTLLILVKKPVAVLLPITLFFAGWWFALPSEQKDTTSNTSSESAQEWTCSMHPQIRQPNPGLCPICNMDLIPLEAGNDEGGLREIVVSAEAAALLDLRVSPVIKAPAQVDVSLFGKIDYDERKIVTTTARISGRIDRLYADFTGTTVSKGDAIAKIYSPELYVAQEELIRAVKSINDSGSQSVRNIRTNLLNAAREKLRLLELTESQIAAIEKQKKPNDHITISAPQSGIIVNLNAKEGQYLKTGDPLFGIAQLNSVWLKMEAYESDLPWLRYAQDVSFKVEALPGKTFHGRIAFIDPQLDPNRRVVKVRVNVENKKLLLKPGMFANANVQANVALHGRVLSADLAGKWISPMHPEIIKDEAGTCDICGMPLVPAEKFGFVAPSGPVENPLLIPVSSVLRTGNRAVVYVRLPNKTEPIFEGREIVLGARAGNYFIVKSGLGVGELVVTKGGYKLDSELQIKAKPSMMNPNAGIQERSANNAPAQIAGQWSSLLRTYGKLALAMEKGDHDSATAELESMKSALESIKHDQLQPKELALWKEFSMRLANILTEVADMPANTSTLSIIRHQMEETRRYVGLSATPIAPIKSDTQWIAPLAATKNAYLSLAKALAADKEQEALKAIPQVITEARKLPSDDHTDKLLQALKHLNMQKNIKGTRAAFKPVSIALISIIRKHGIDHLGNLYVIHCPMADKNKGGDWLSEKNEVRNPYFGSSMLGCGDVTDTLSKGSK